MAADADRSSSPEDHIILTEEELAKMTVSELYQLTHGFPESEVIKLKQRRTLIKNRVYSKRHRCKKSERRAVLEEEKGNLKEQLKKLRIENEILRKERDEALAKLHSFEKNTESDSLAIQEFA